MNATRNRYGLLTSGLGAMMLGISVYLPWYGLTLSPQGVALIQQMSTQFAARYGNAAMQARLAPLRGELSALAGHQFATVTAAQVSKSISTLLVIIAVVGILISLIPLARPQTSEPRGDGSILILLGILASMLVIYRLLQAPGTDVDPIESSLQAGAWLALAGSLTMVVGVFLPGRAGAPVSSGGDPGGVWSELSGWTPESESQEAGTSA